MRYGGFLAKYRNPLNPNTASSSTLAARHLPLGFFAPRFFGSTFSAFNAANG